MGYWDRLVPTQEQIEEMSCHIKSHFSQQVTVLYGGSVNSKTSEILDMHILMEFW